MAIAVQPSTIASVIDYLVAQCRASTAFPQVTAIYDGPVTTDNPVQGICIGAATALAEPTEIEVAGGQVAWRTIGATLRDENYTLHCLSFCAVGGESFKVARDTAMSIYNVFDAIYRADLTLGGLVSVSTTATDVALEYAYPSSGPVVVLRWGLAVRNVLR
jgi:hypothetical protein